MQVVTWGAANMGTPAAILGLKSLGFRVWDLSLGFGFRVWVFGFRVLGFRVWGPGSFQGFLLKGFLLGCVLLGGAGGLVSRL